MRSSSSTGRVARVALGGAVLAGAPAAHGAEVTLTAREFVLEPETVTVEQGEPVRLVLENMGVLAHNVTLPRLSDGTRTIQSEERAVLEFTAPAPGEYEIVCTVPGHADAGMRATLRVE